MEDTIIRTARMEDEQAVYDLMMELEEGYTDVDSTLFHALYSQNTRRKDIVYLVALTAGRVTGFGSLYIQPLLHHGGLVAEIQELVVSAQYRGCGIGAMLVKALTNAARQEGCAQIEVCCRTGRTRSNAFYARQGFRQTHFKHVMEVRT